MTLKELIEDFDSNAEKLSFPKVDNDYYHRLGELIEESPVVSEKFNV